MDLQCKPLLRVTFSLVCVGEDKLVFSHLGMCTYSNAYTMTKRSAPTCGEWEQVYCIGWEVLTWFKALFRFFTFH